MRRDDTAAPTILVLPGNRRSEVRHLLPPFGEAIALVAAQLPRARFVLPAVPRLVEAITQLTARWRVKPEIVTGEAAKLAAFREARAALAASNYVTLELALAQVPTVAAYRGAGWEAALARRLIKLPSVILPNLIIGENVVPEFIQDEASPQALAAALLAATVDGAARQRQLDGFAGVEQSMRSAGPSPRRTPSMQRSLWFGSRQAADSPLLDDRAGRGDRAPFRQLGLDVLAQAPASSRRSRR